MDLAQGAFEFVEVVRTGSFSAAARALGKSKAYISQRVSRLEDRLGTRLLQRTTRKLSLTEAGEVYFKYVSQAANKLLEGEERARDLQLNLKGKLRVSIVDGGLGEWYLAPALASFASQNPGVTIELDLTSRVVDLVAEGFDFVIRVGELEDSSLIARKLTSFRFGLYVSPGYLELNGMIAKPEQLRDHNCLTGASARWILERDGRKLELLPRGSWHSKSGQALLAAARMGVGVVRTASFYARDALVAGEVVEILPDWTREQTPVWVVYPSHHNLPRRVTSAMAFLLDSFRGRPLPGQVA